MDTLEVVREYRQEDSWNLFAVEPLIGSLIMPSRAHTPGLRDGSPAYYSKQVSPWEVASRATLGHAGVSGVWLSGGHFGYKYPLALVVLYTHVAGTSVCSYLH